MAEPGFTQRSPRNIYDVQAEFTQQLLAHNSAAATRMVRQYAKIYAELVARGDRLLRDLIQANATGTPLTDDFLFRQQRIAALKLQVAREIAKFAADADRATADQQRTAIDLAQQHSQDLIGAALAGSAPGYAASFAQLPSHALTHLVGFLGDGSPLKELFDTLGPQAAEAAADVLFRAVATGLHPTVAGRQLRTALGVPLTRALAIARTEMLRSYREATRQSYLANDDVVKGWRWNAKLDRRTCASCWAMHGTVHSLDERLDDHVNGRCVASPITRTWEELGFPRSVSKLAPPRLPSQVPGVDAFKKLPGWAQQSILGPGKMALYRDGRIDLQDTVEQTVSPRWGSMRREASIAQALANHRKPKPWLVFDAPSVTPHPQPPERAVASKIAPPLRKRLKPTVDQLLRQDERKIYRDAGGETVVVRDATGRQLFRRSAFGTSIGLSDVDLASGIWRGALATHNHPRGWAFPRNDPRRAGNSFSLEDIATAAKAELAEMRAVTPTRLYTMHPPDSGWDAHWVQSQLLPVFRQADIAVRQELTVAVGNGSMSREEAEARYWDTVWKRVASRLGLTYIGEDHGYRARSRP